MMLEANVRAPTSARISDAEVVRMAAQVLRDPRAWAEAGMIDPHGLVARQVRARALALMAEALATV